MGGAVDWHEAEGGENNAASYPQLGEQLNAADVAQHYRQGIEWVRGSYAQFELQEHEALALLDMNKWSAENLHELSEHAVGQLRKEVGALDVPSPGATAEGHICPIEMEVQTAESGVLLACGHCFSTEAISEYIRTEVLESQVPVRCPMHVSGCPLVLSWAETVDLGTREGEGSSRGIQSTSSRATFQEVLTAKLAPRMAARMGLRQCVSCSSFLHPSPSDFAHLTCQSCQTSFCGHCSHPPHLPLPCEFASMHDEWAGFLDRMTMSAKDLARDPSQAAALSKAQLDAAKAFSQRLDNLLPLPAPSPDLPTSGPSAHFPSLSERNNPEEPSGPTKSDEPPTAASEAVDAAAAQAAALREYDLRAETKPCPACGEPYEKNAGCSHFTCKKCGWQFCWVCSKPWKNHSVCAALDVESYGFEEEMEWYRRKAKEGDRRADDVDLEATRARRREQMRDMQRHYVGRVEKENQSMADMRWRRLPQDALGHFLANYEQMGTMLLQGMRAAKTCVRPGYANVAMSAGVTARSMRRIEALRPLAALLERGAMAVMAIDEHRGGLSPEHLFNQLEQTRAPGTLDGGFEDGMLGLPEAVCSIQAKVMAIERMAVVIIAKESPAGPSQRKRNSGGAAMGPRQGDTEVAAYLKDGAGMVAEHFDVLSTWAQAWSTVASLVLSHFETLRALRQTALTALLLNMGHEGLDAMHMGEREWLGMRHMMMLRERERLLLHRRRDWGDRGLAQRPRDERRDEAYGIRDPYPHRLNNRDPGPPAAYPPMHDRDLPRYGMRGGAEAARPRLLGGYASSTLGAGPGPMTREHRTRGANVTTSATSMATDTMTTTTSTGGGVPPQPGPLRHTGFMDMDDDWEVMGMHELEDEMAMFFEDMEAHPPLPPPPLLPAPDLLPFLHPPDAPMPHPALQVHHHHQLMMLDMTLEAPRRYLETFQQSVHESELVDDATRAEFVDIFGDVHGAKNLQDGRRAKAAITEAKNRRQFALQRILEGVLSRRRPLEGEGPCTSDRISYAQRRESLRERCLLALRAHFERPCTFPLPSRRAHPSLFPGLDPQAAEHDDDDERCLDYFRVYELLIHLGVLPAPSMEEDLPARLAYINLIKALDARPRVRSPQPAPEEAPQGMTTTSSNSSNGSGESNGSCGGKRTFDESLLHSPSSASGSLTVKKREAARRRMAGLGGQKQRRADMLTLFTFLQRQEASS